VDEREAETGVEEVLSVLATDVLASDRLDADDVDGSVGSTVVRGHVVVELLDSTAAGGVTELLVEVVSGVGRVVAEGDAKVLDGLGVGLDDLVAGKDLTGHALDPAELAEEVPETGLGNDLVGSEDAHAVDLLVLLSDGVALAANDLVFTHFVLTLKNEKKSHVL